MSVKHTIVGKTIAQVEYVASGNDEAMVMTFTDGSVFTITSWAANEREGLESGLISGCADNQEAE